MNKILNVAHAKNSTDEIVVYTFLNVREKITSFCQALKRCTQKKVGSFFLSHGVDIIQTGGGIVRLQVMLLSA